MAAWGARRLCDRRCAEGLLLVANSRINHALRMAGIGASASLATSSPNAGSPCAERSSSEFPVVANPLYSRHSRADGDAAPSANLAGVSEPPLHTENALPMKFACGVHRVNRQPRIALCSRERRLALPRPFKGAILAPKSPGSGECRWIRGVTWLILKSKTGLVT